MNVAGETELNVLKLVEKVETIPDPIAELLAEGEAETETLTDDETFVERRMLVSEENFPDQSMYILEQQLRELRENLNRIKFYLGDIDDLLPK